MKFIKSDECHAIIEIIMAFFTLISVITVGYSINEMKMQRESAYKPVLSIGESIYTYEGNVYYSYHDGGYLCLLDEIYCYRESSSKFVVQINLLFHLKQIQYTNNLAGVIFHTCFFL